MLPSSGATRSTRAHRHVPFRAALSDREPPVPPTFSGTPDQPAHEPHGGPSTRSAACTNQIITTAAPPPSGSGSPDVIAASRDRPRASAIGSWEAPPPIVHSWAADIQQPSCRLFVARISLPPGHHETPHPPKAATPSPCARPPDPWSLRETTPYQSAGVAYGEGKDLPSGEQYPRTRRTCRGVFT